MKKTILHLILFSILVLFSINLGTVSAQSVDIDNLSNEELLDLLQEILKKLEQDPETGRNGQETELNEISDSASLIGAALKLAAKRETKKFSVYTNKKLVVGRMPDYYFIRKQRGDGEETDSGSDSGAMRTLEFHYGDYSFTIDIPDGDYGEYGIPTDVWTAW